MANLDSNQLSEVAALVDHIQTFESESETISLSCVMVENPGGTHLGSVVWDSDVEKFVWSQSS